MNANVQPGQRVFAISYQDAETKTAAVFGSGVYDGMTVPSADAQGPVAKALREMERPNPQITLDTGVVVWGCECWWMSEKQGLAYMDNLRRAGWIIQACDPLRPDPLLA